MNNDENNAEKIIKEIEQSIKQDPTKLGKNVKANAEFIINYRQKQYEIQRKKDSYENYIEGCSNLLKLCRSKCGFVDVNKDIDQTCASACVRKYIEQFEIVKNMDDLYSYELKLKGLLFYIPEHLDELKLLNVNEEKI